MKLFPFQLAGAAWLQEKERAYLADSPGLGKTIQVIQALKARGALRPQVICPASAVPVWKLEAERWNLTAPLEVISYDRFVRNHETQAPRIRKETDVLILDEAHYLKSGTAQRTKLILGRAGVIVKDMAVWCLSGTPSPNHYGELFVPLAALWPDFLIEHGWTNYEKFLNEFAVWKTVEFNRVKRIQVIRGKNGDKLRFLMNQHDVMLRRTMEEAGLDLPGIFWQDIPVESDPPVEMEQENELAANVERLDPAGWAVERHELGKRKAAGASDAIRELLDGDPTSKHVVMAYHRDVLDLLGDDLMPYGVVRLDGDSSPEARGEAVDLFQRNPNCRVFLGQSVACREAITLTASSMIHIVEPFWTPEYNVQLAGRIRRISQKAEHVIARMYYAPKSPLDSAMTATLLRKARDMEILYGDGA